MTKKRLTPQQKKALKAYEIAEHEEDRFMGSVFVNEYNARKYREATEAAHAECKRLGMTTEHGL